MNLLLYIFLSNIIITYGYNNCNFCRYLYKNNKCFLFIKNTNQEIVYKSEKLKYDLIPNNLHANINDCRNNESLCGENATYYKKIY